MAAVTSIILVKQFTYRDDPTEQFSNRYYLRNAPPGDQASWKQLCDDLINIEKPVFPPSVHYVTAYGYNDDAANAQSVFFHDYTQDASPPAGTYGGTGQSCAGDQAALVFWKTDRKNARGKYIYYRKYFHASTVSVGDRDMIDQTHHDAYMTLVNALHPVVGAFWGGIRSRTHADGIIASGVGEWITTRTLKRRGKRPLAHA